MHERTHSHARTRNAKRKALCLKQRPSALATTARVRNDCASLSLSYLLYKREVSVTGGRVTPFIQSMNLCSAWDTGVGWKVPKCCVSLSPPEVNVYWADGVHDETSKRNAAVDV